MSCFHAGRLARQTILFANKTAKASPPVLIVVVLGVSLGVAGQAAKAQSTLPALEGRVFNGTTNRPAANVLVEYVLLREGMVPVDVATTDAEGHFRLEKAQAPEGPALLRVEYQGATYSLPLPPTGGPSGSIEIQVFEAGREASLIQAREHAIFVHPTGDTLRVLEQIILENNSKPPRTYVAPGGTYRFSLPGVPRESLRVSVEGPAGMPISQTPAPTGKENQFSLAYPIRPGETQVQLEYELSYQQPFEFSKPLDFPAQQTHIVTPGEQVQVSGENLQALGPEPTTGYLAYQVTPAGNALRFQVSGEAPEQAVAEGAEEASGSLVSIPDPMSERRWVVLGLVGVVLLAGFIYHYRHS